MAGAALRKPQVILTSDASGSWGCGAYTSTGEWFQLALMEDWNGVHITVKEFLPIVLGVAMWGAQMEGSHSAMLLWWPL